MLASIRRRACARCCLQRRSSPWPVLRPRAAPAPPSSSSSSSSGSSTACWPAVSRAYSSRTNSRNGGTITNTTTNNNSTGSTSSARQSRPPATIAVLGGGVTGLTTAYYLTKFLPSARITLYEASDRLGGWVDSHTMDLHRRLKNGMPARVVCEYGPRLITPTEKNFAEMLVYAELLHYLNLTDKTWTVHKPPIDSRQADPLSRRYIYYPDHLVELPGPRFAFRTRFVRSCRILVRFLYDMVRKLATEPLLAGVLPALWRWLSSPPRAGEILRDVGASRRRKLVERLAAAPDESVGDFFTAYLGDRRLVDNVIAAMVHGIYGGSPWRLSVQSSAFLHTAIQDYVGLSLGEKIETKANAALNEEIFLEPTEKGSAIRDLFLKGTVAFDIVRATGFLNGFSTFTNALADALHANPNVEIRLNEPVINLGYIQAGQESSVRVKTNKTSRSYSKVISTIFAKRLADITDGRLPALADMEAVTMQVVNLYYPEQHLNHPHQGFGYLIPPTAEVAPGVLGVIFDSDREEAVAESFYYRHGAHPAGDTVSGTKLTVMLRVDEQTGPRTEDEASRLAHAVVCSHLGLPEKYTILDRTFASVKTARDCIPQHGVGHRARLAAAHAQLLAGYGGRLAVAGTSYTAPGLLPAMRAGRDIAAEVAGRGYETAYARRLAEQPEYRVTIIYDGDPSWDPVKEGPVGVGDTGLARFRDDHTWASEFFPYREKGVLFPGHDGKLARWGFDRH